MFTELVKTLEKNGKGIHAYRKCADRARELAMSSPDLAASYFLLAAMAEDFVEFNERMATTTVQSNAVFERFAGNAALLDDAFGDGDPGKMLTMLNRIASELAKRGAQFT